MLRDSDAHRAWVKQLPQSRMVYPKTISMRVRYFFWRLYGPYHPRLRDSAIALRVVKNHGRQPFLLGTLSADISIEEFVAYLIEQGFAYHRVAWEDDDEIVGLRRVHDFIYQYHIRVFQDREVRAHYEYTPECYPLAHLLNSGFEDRRDEFMAIFGHMIEPIEKDAYHFRWEILPLLQRIWK